MTAPAEHAGSPADMAARIEATRPVRGLATAVGAVFTAIGWMVARVFVLLAAVFLAVGWIVGLCFRGIIYGFQLGANLPQPEQSPPAPRPGSVL